MVTFEKITQYFEYLDREFNLKVRIKDFCAFIPANKTLHTAMQPYINHQQDFCLYIKRDSEAYFTCLSMIPRIMKKCVEQKKTFFGTCHAGISEYVIPIISGDSCIGALTLGCFASPQEELEKRLSKLAKINTALDYETLLRKIENLDKPKLSDVNGILFALEIIAAYIALTYKNVGTINADIMFGNKQKQPDKDELLESVLNYIKENFSQQIKMEDIAEHCNYSVSYISRKFNNIIGMNINTYINKMRIEVSTNYLVTSEKTISEISAMVGYDDASYYCKVFTQIIGLSPTEYRKNFK